MPDEDEQARYGQDQDPGMAAGDEDGGGEAKKDQVDGGPRQGRSELAAKAAGRR